MKNVKASLTALSLIFLSLSVSAQQISPGGGGTGSVTSPGGTSGQVQYNNAGVFGGFSVAGDCTLSTSGNITCNKTSGASFAPSATTDTTNASNITSGTLANTVGGTGTNTSFTKGSVVFSGNAGTYVQDNAKIFWDDVNYRLGLLTNVPAYTLDVETTTSTIQMYVGSSNTSGTRGWAVSNTATGGKTYNFTSTGYNSGAAGWAGFEDNNAVQPFAFNNGQVRTLSNGVFQFSNSSTYTWSVSADTGISRDAAGVVDIGNGSQGNKSGTLQAAIFNPGASQSTLTGTTAGSISYSEPFQGASSKKFLAYASGYENNSAVNQTITFPVAFSNTPIVLGNSTGLTVSATTTTLTITAPNSTTLFSGDIIVEGF